MTTKHNEEEIIIPSIARREVVVSLEGDSPLLVHRWSEKAKKMILDKQTRRAKTSGHDLKEPVQDFIDSLYWISGEPEEKNEEGFLQAVSSGEARFGFPTVAFKNAAIDGAYRRGAIPNKVSMRAAFHVFPADLVEIVSDQPPVMREDMVTVGMGLPDIRYRGQFDHWSAEMLVSYDTALLSLEQLINMFNLGGFACGVGEWRVEKGGTCGMFHVV